MKKFEIDIGQLINTEETEEKHRNEKLEEEKEFEADKEAYVDGLNSDELFLGMFNEDPEGQKLNETPGADELLNEYHDKFVLVCKEMYVFGKSQKEQRQKEVEEFWKCLVEAKQANTEEATVEINRFTEWKKTVSDKLHCIV